MSVIENESIQDWAIKEHFDYSEIEHDKNKKIIKRIIENTYNDAYDQLEKKLFQIGYVLINGSIYTVEEAKTFNNPLVQDAIQELEYKIVEDWLKP